MKKPYLSEFVFILLLFTHFYTFEAFLISFNQIGNSHQKAENHSVFLTSETNDQSDLEVDTVRVRIWRALSMKKEMSLRQLGSAVGERNMGDLKSHLLHVEKQAKTIGNKSDEWKIRRGLCPKVRKVKLTSRRGDKGSMYIKMDL